MDKTPAKKPRSVCHHPPHCGNPLQLQLHPPSLAVGFGFVVGASMLFASCLGGFAGAATPLLYRKLGMDPASCAGPLDTALQDVLANSAFLAAAGALIGIFGY